MHQHGWLTTPASGELTDYARLLRKRAFMPKTLSLTPFCASAHAFIAEDPQVYMEHFHVAPQHYPLLFALNIIGEMVVSAINWPLVQHCNLDPPLRMSTDMAVAAMIAGVFSVGNGAWPCWCLPSSQ